MNKLTHTICNKHCTITRTKQSGFSLIEIMVAALVLSIGILGVVALQVVGLKGSHQSYMKQQAMGVVQNLTERMRSNVPGVLTDHYLFSDSDTFDCAVTAIPNCSDASSSCNPQDLALADMHNLICGYKTDTASRTGGIRNLESDDISTFISGRLGVTCPSGCETGDVRIQVNWTEQQLRDEQVVEDSLVVNTRITR